MPYLIVMEAHKHAAKIAMGPNQLVADFLRKFDTHGLNSDASNCLKSPTETVWLAISDIAIIIN
ncbi:hypothetical protein WP50_18455 [Lactiplantibacillus plantarum]|nr:hypothetical protein WP50_18455 [Lactiplantibacillus plantarum]